MIWTMLRYGRNVIIKCKKDNISAFAAQSAFFLLISLIPFLMVFSSMLKYTIVSEAMLLDMVNQIMPEYIAAFMVSVIHEVYNKSVGIVSVTAIVAVWSAAKGVQYMAAGLNRVYGLKETRNWFFRRLWATIYTTVFLLAIVITMVLLVFGDILKSFLVNQIPFVVHIIHVLLQFRGFIMIGFMSCIFTVIYKTLPNNKELFSKKLTLKNQFPGAVLCAVIWYLFSLGISIYVDYFNGFSMYGSLTTIVLFMLWLYFGMYSMMLCAEINEEISVFFS